MLGEEHGWTDKDLIRYVKYYATADVEELWDTIYIADTESDKWIKMKKGIKGFYPSLTEGKKYSVADLERLVSEWSGKAIKSREEFGEYRREFMMRAEYLIQRKKYTKREASHAFLKGISGELRGSLLRRLEIKVPDHEEGEPYQIEELVEHADFVLGGLSFRSDSTGSRELKTTEVKTEEWTMQTLAKQLNEVQMALNAFVQGSGGRQTGTAKGTAYEAGAARMLPPRISGCMFCGEPGHFVRACPKVAEYIGQGKCARSPDGRVMMINGSAVPNDPPGRPLKERIDKFWSSQNVASASVNLIDIDAEPESTPHQPAFITEEADEEPTYEEDFRDVYAAEPRRRGAPGKQGRNEAPPQQQPSNPVSGSQQTSGRAGVSARQTTKPVPTGLGSKYKAGETSQPQPQPQFRYQAPIEDRRIAPSVIDKVLDVPITITNRELLALAPDIRRQIKELTTTKRISPVEGNLVDIENERETFLSAAEQSRIGLVQTQDGYDFASTAAESMPLRTVKATVEGVGDVECLLDQGSAVCIIREDLWQKLGIHVRKDQTINLISADLGRNSTLGLCPNVRFVIAGLEVQLHVQVVTRAPFRCLLGRPFFALTECVTEDRDNGEQRITLSDPLNRERRCMVNTGVRMKEEFPQGFQ